MPKGPNGQKRPGDVIGAAIMVARIATGEEAESPTSLPREQVHAAKKSGGVARARKLTAAERSKIASAAAKARWKKAPAALENEE